MVWGKLSEMDFLDIYLPRFSQRSWQAGAVGSVHGDGRRMTLWIMACMYVLWREIIPYGFLRILVSVWVNGVVF